MGFDKEDCIFCYLACGYNDYCCNCKEECDCGDDIFEEHSSTICGNCIEKMLSYDSLTSRVMLILKENLNITTKLCCVLCEKNKNLTFEVMCCDSHYGVYKK